MKLSHKKKLDWSGDHLFSLILHNELRYYLCMDADTIFIYQKVLFGISKLLWDDIRI